MKQVLVDTDVIIDYTKGKDDALARLFELQSKGEIELYITPVNIAEFLNDTALKNLEKQNKAQDFLRLFSVCDLTSVIGVVAGGYLQKKTISYLGDALIAAACTEHRLVLMTRNRRHFSFVSGLIFYEPVN